MIITLYILSFMIVALVIMDYKDTKKRKQEDLEAIQRIIKSREAHRRYVNARINRNQQG